MENFILNFTSILYEALPFIVLGSVLSGFLEEMVPQRFVANLIPRNRFLAIALSALLGLIFPMCECGIVPVMRRLLRKGLPLSCCIAYMLAGPIINFVVILSTVVAFAPHAPRMMGGPWMVSFRIGVAYLVALGASLVVERLHRRHGSRELLVPLALPPAKPDSATEDNDPALSSRKGFVRRLGNITETALHDFVDITVFLILGALLAAASREYFTLPRIETWSQNYPTGMIGIMMGLAVLLCLCSEADAFVAASFTTMQPAAKLAFLTLGPMLDLKLYMMYTRVFRPRLIWTLIPTVVIQVLIYALIVHVFWMNFGREYVISAQ